MKKILTVVGDTLYLLLMFAAAIAVVTIMVILFTPPASAEESQSKLLDPTNDPWDSVLRVRVVEVDEWGCQRQSGLSTQYMEWVERRVCAQNFDDFYARMSSAQKQKALEEGLSLLPDGYAEARTITHGEEWVKEAAMNKWFLTYTGANPS